MCRNRFISASRRVPATISLPEKVFVFEKFFLILTQSIVVWGSDEIIGCKKKSLRCRRRGRYGLLYGFRAYTGYHGPDQGSRCEILAGAAFGVSAFSPAGLHRFGHWTSAPMELHCSQSIISNSLTKLGRILDLSRSCEDLAVYAFGNARVRAAVL